MRCNQPGIFLAHEVWNGIHDDGCTLHGLGDIVSYERNLPEFAGRLAVDIKDFDAPLGFHSCNFFHAAGEESYLVPHLAEICS